MVVRRGTIIIFVFISFLFGAFEYLPRAPLNVGEGAAGLNFSGGIAGMYLDPASLTSSPGNGFAFQGGRQFGLRALQHQSGVGILQTKLIPLGFGFTSFGNRSYSEVSFGFFTAHQLGEKIQWGIEANLYSLAIRNYGSDAALGLTVAWHMKLFPQVEWGTILRNITNPTIGREVEPLPQIIISGFLLEAHRNLNIQVEWEQDTAYKGELKYGVLFKLKPWFSVSTGFRNRTGQFSAALELQLNYLSLSYATVTHPQLGISQWIGIAVPLVKP